MSRRGDSRIPAATVGAIGHTGQVTSLPSSPRLASSRSGSRSRAALAVGATLSLVGLLVVVTGTFLPWLTSGGVKRNSYAVLGIVRRLRFLDGGPTATAISLWPLLGTVAMVPVIAGILHWWRIAAVTTLLFGVLTGLGAAGVLAVAGGHGGAGIALSPTGPSVTTAGAVLAVLGGVLVLLSRRRSRPARRPARPSRDVSGEPSDGPVRRTAHSATLDGSPRCLPHSPQETAHSTTAVETERENAG